MILRTDLSKLPVLAEGGEGIIYEYQSQLIKVYKQNIRRDIKSKKVHALMKKKLPTGVVAPLDVVYDHNRNFVDSSKCKYQLTKSTDLGTSGYGCWVSDA